VGKTLVFKIDIDENIHIELIGEHHAQQLYDLIEKNRDELKLRLPWVMSVTSCEDEQNAIKKMMNDYATKGDLHTPIFYKGKMVGMASLLQRNRLGLTHGDIGYWLDKEYQGLGIITKVCKKMLDIGFNTYNLGKITLHCATTNPKSCNIAKRVGMQHDGTLRAEGKVDGIIEDIMVYSILKSEYKG